MVAITSKNFRKIMGCFATGVTVVAMAHPNAPHPPIGITINSFTSVSLDPPLVAFCLKRKASIAPFLRKSKNFTVNILGAHQEEISRAFAETSCPVLSNLWTSGQAALRDTMGAIICQTIKIIRAGDHDIFLAKVLKIQHNAKVKKPLIYFQGGYKT